MDKVILPDLETASVIALQALTFLAQDVSQFERFSALTGIAVSDLRTSANEPQMQASVLGYLAQDESLLLMFTANNDIDPALISPALYVLENA